MTDKLKFNLLKFTNDPRENKYRHYSVVGFSLEEELSNKSNKVSERLNEVVLNYAKVCCFCRNSSNGINSGYAKSRMWSQYAENHKGICLVFSKEPLLKDVRTQVDKDFFVYGEKVDYSNEGINLIAMLIKGNELEEVTPLEYTYIHINEHYKEIFYKKDKDYRDEREFRITVIDNANEPKYIDIKDSLRGVILGVDFEDVYQPLVNEYCRNRSITLYKMYLDTKGKIRIREVSKN